MYTYRVRKWGMAVPQKSRPAPSLIARNYALTAAATVHFRQFVSVRITSYKRVLSQVAEGLTSDSITSSNTTWVDFLRTEVVREKYKISLKMR